MVQFYCWCYQFPCIFATVYFYYYNSATSHSSSDAHTRYKRIVSKAYHKNFPDPSPPHPYESAIQPPCQPSTISTLSQELLHLSPSDIYTAILAPYARIYMAFNYGIALEVLSIVAPSPSILSIRIRACAVHNVTNSIILSKYFQSVYSSFDFHPCSPSNPAKKCKNVCEESLSLYARLVGQQIHVGDSTMSRSENTCTWTVHFSPLNDHLNESMLEVYYLWLNELNDPSNQKEVVLTNKEKSERINDGNILNLGGIGHVPPYVLNATLTWCDFGGLIMKETRSRDIYLITRRNKEKRLFSSWDHFSALGFNSSDIIAVASYFLSLICTGPDISMSNRSSLSAVTAERWREQSSCDVSAARKVIKDRSYSLTVDSPSRDMALIYGTPISIAPFNTSSSSSSSAARLVSHSAVWSTALPWCVDEASTEGRWQRDSRCSGFAIRHFNLSMTDSNFTDPTSDSSSSSTMCSSALYFVGDPCRHTLPPLLDYMPYYFRKKDADFVWRPFHCRLVPFVPVPVSLRDTDYCDIVDRNASVFLSTHADMHNISNSACSHTMDGKASAASLAAICLRSSGIGFIAGFGDSLGNELNDNLMNLLLLSDQWAPGAGVRCSNSGKRKLHRLKVEEMGSNTSLVSCIESTAIALQQSLSENVNRSLVNEFTFREVVLVTNFMSQHSVWLLTLREIREHLQLQRDQHARLGQRLALLGLRYRRIFYSAVAVHGFRAGGLTPARQRWFNDQARSILAVDGRWEVLDAYNMTVGQPGGTVDGVHYRGGVSIAIADALMNMLCNGRCNRTG